MAVVTTAAAVTAAGTAYAANKSSKASKQQTQALEKSQDITRQATKEARADAINLFDRGLQQQAEGFNRSINLLSGGLQPQANMMNQGNLNAQNTLLSGGQGYMNAILGNSANPYAGLSAQQVTPDFSYLTNFVDQQSQIANPPPKEKRPDQQPVMGPYQQHFNQLNQGNGSLSVGPRGANSFGFTPFGVMDRRF